METKSTQQEILLMTGTSFSARNYCEKDDTGNPNHLSEIEQLEEACWNGLLPELLPEVFENNSRRLYVWQITEGTSFLELELGEYPEMKDKLSSIDPYAFLEVLCYN